MSVQGTWQDEGNTPLNQLECCSFRETPKTWPLRFLSFRKQRAVSSIWGWNNDQTCNNILKLLFREHFKLHLSLTMGNNDACIVSLTGCSSRCPQNGSQIEGKPCLWCHLLLYCCQPISMLCGKPAPVPCSLVEGDERDRGGITFPTILQVTMFGICLKPLRFLLYLMYSQLQLLPFPLLFVMPEICCQSSTLVWVTLRRTNLWWCSLMGWILSETAEVSSPLIGYRSSFQRSGKIHTLSYTLSNTNEVLAHTIFLKRGKLADVFIAT